MGRRWGVSQVDLTSEAPVSIEDWPERTPPSASPAGPVSRVSQPEPFLMAFLSAGKGARSSQPLPWLGPASMSVH